MKYMAFLVALALAGTASAQAAVESDGQTIIVTATSLAQTERALRECLARNCPPDEDASASLAHAENLFVAGDYERARRVTRASLARTGDHAGRHPVPVSDLYRADSRIAAHLGEGRDYERATWGIKRALKEGLPDSDPRLVGADLEVANMYAALGRFDSARDSYADAAKDAERIGRPDLAAMARLRLAWLSQIEGNRDLTRRKLKAIAEDLRPEVRVARLSALILLARLDRQEGRQGSSDALIGELRNAGLAAPVLLFAPEIKLDNRGIDQGGSVTRLMAMQNFEDRWVDIGFWVTPEGRASEVEILRNSGDTGWTAPLLRSIAGRIYSPASANRDGTYRVERYSLTSLWMDRAGTRIRQRSPDARIEYLDLTAPAAPVRAN